MKKEKAIVENIKPQPDEHYYVNSAEAIGQDFITAGTSVTTPRGRKLIEELKKGDELFSISGAKNNN